MKAEVIALYCLDLCELMIDSGRTFKVPAQIAATVTRANPDTRFVKSWAVIHRLIPSEAQVSVFTAPGFDFTVEAAA